MERIMNDKKGPYPSFSTVFLIILAAVVFNASLKYWGGLGKNTAAEKTISDYAEEQGFKLSDYPNEIVNLFKINEETKDFVLKYPSKVVDFQPDVLNFSEYANCTEPPQLMQWDLRWGYMPYNGSVMGLSGSAPTALSMAALYVTHDVTLTPVHMVQFASGSAMESKPEKLLSDGARSMGMNVMEIPKNDNRLRQALSEPGAVVVCLTDGKAFSQAIVVRGVDDEGKFLIRDTLSSKRGEKSYSFNELSGSIRKIWRYTPASAEPAE